MEKAAYVHDYGGKGQTIVLLHGFLGSSKYWSRLAPKLVNAGYKVIAFDLIGFGKSHKPNEANYDYADHVDFITKTLNSHNITTPILLIGHSMGAIIAKRFALLHSSHIKQLVLLHPPLYRNEAEARAVLRSTGFTYRLLLDSRLRDAAWFVLSRVRIFKISSHTKYSREQSLRNIIEKAEALSDVMKLKSKTLLVIGAKDRPQYIRNVNDVVLPQNVNVVYEDLSHHSPVTDPNKVSQLITSFAKTTL